ncbi:MAG TPA: transporter substrate-binding domain-containing protein [Pseudobacteroides sp.]|uniref:substrate-binding periplasmic protein n=1 Tax=Pseudobacteroides sp. TaxID=1968840 RepID=UPI002F95E5A2
MRRYIYFVIILALIFAFSGCGSSEVVSSDEKNNESLASPVAKVNNEPQSSAANSDKQKEVVKGEKAINEIEVSWFDNPPHIYMDKQTGKLTGAAYKLLEEQIAPKMNIKFVWDKESSAIPRQTSNFEANTKAFASALLTRNPDREKISICSSKTYFQSQTAMVVKKDNPLNEIKKVDEIINLKIGYAEKSFVSPFMKDSRIKFDNTTASNYHETNLKKLVAGRIDAVYAPDKAALLGVVKQLGMENDVKILNLPEEKAPFFVVFSKAASDIANKYNEVTNGMDLEKEYNSLLSQFIDTSKL